MDSILRSGRCYPINLFCIYDKSEPLSYRKKVRIILVWSGLRGSNSKKGFLPLIINADKSFCYGIYRRFSFSCFWCLQVVYSENKHQVSTKFQSIKGMEYHQYSSGIALLNCNSYADSNSDIISLNFLRSSFIALENAMSSQSPLSFL